MIGSILTLLPNIAAAGTCIAVTWFVARMWYNSRYIHRSEVRPLQESQNIMQNQYAVLAERIKNSESLLTETKAKLETISREKELALLKIRELEIRNPGLDTSALESWKHELLNDLQLTFATAAAETDKNPGKDQINFLRQAIKELKTDLAQKSNTASYQYHELTNQVWQLIELNKKLSAETEQLSRLISGAPGSEDDPKLSERPFTLASIKKRS